MAGNIPAGSMSTEIKLNGSQSVHTLRELKQAVTQATSAWKAQRAELSSIGKSTQAAETKYRGLAETVKKQKDYISGLQSEQRHLEEAQKSVDRSTREGQQEYGKYNEALQKNETRIHSAETRLTSLTNQQSKARKSLDYYKSGLADAQKQLKSSSELTRSYVDRLQAEGKTYEASRAKLNGYKDSVENLSKQEKIQEQELNKIASESGKTSDAYKRQQIRVNETATSLAKAKTQMRDLNETMQHSNPSFLDRIKDKLSSVNHEADETHHTFKEVFMGSALGNALSNSLSNIGSGLMSAYHNGMNLNEAMAKINGRFTGMNLGARSIRALDKQISQLKGDTLMTDENVSNVQSRMINWSNIGVKGAMQMTKMIAGVGDSSKLTGDQIDQMSAGLMRVGSTGKVTWSTLNRITKVAPTFMTQLARGAGMSENKLRALLKTGNVTQTQFQKWMAAAAKYSDTAFSKFGATQVGAMQKMKSKWDDLERDMTAPIFSAKTTGLQALKDLLTSHAVTNGAKDIGRGIASVIEYLDKHKKDISDTAKDLLSITGAIAKDVWNDFAGIVTDIGKSFGLIHDNAKKSGGPLHSVRLALDGLAKNKTAVKVIADTLMVVAGMKFANAIGGLFHINKLLLGATNAASGLAKGLKGIEDTSKLKGVEKHFAKLGQLIRKTTKFSVGKRLGVGAIAGGVVAAPEIVNAVKNRHSATKRSQNIGGAVGAIAGGTLTSMIPVVGPMLAPIGAIIGKYAGRWGGQAVNKFTKGWQRKKPPKKFWSLENLGWSAHNMWNGFTKSVGKTIKWFKKNWKEVGLYFVSPLAGAINSLYKHDKKFRKWVNGLAKGFKNAWKGTVKWFSNLGKNIQKAWHGMTKWFTKLGKNMAKGLKSSWKSITKWFSNIGKGIQKAWRGMVSWFTKLGRNMSKGLTSAWHGVVKFFTSIVRVVKHTWNTTVNFFRTLGRNTVNLFKAPWKTLVSWFKGIIDGIKEIWDAFWDKVSGPIKFIAKLLGGKIKVGKLHLASGTDWHKKYGVPAIVNDAPGQHYREGLIDTDGSIGLFPDKRNLPFWLKPGQDIINGEDMARMFGRAVHYANGTKTLVTETLESTDKPNSSHLLQKFVNVVQAHYKLASDEARKRDARYADSILHRNKLDRRRNKKDRENEEAKVKTLVTKTEESTQNPKYSRLISKNLVTKLVGNTDKQTKLVSKGVDLYQKDRVSRLLAENRSKQDSIKIIEAQKELTKAVKDGHKKEASTLRKELSKLKKDRTKQNHIASTRIRDLQATPAQRKAAQKKVVSDRKKLKALGDKIAKALSSGHASQVKSLTARFNVISKDLSLQKRLSKKPNPHLGQTFVDEGLLVGANRRIGHSEWISNSLFDKLTSKKKKKKKTKKRKSKKRKTRKTRRRKRSTRRRTTEVRISGGHVTGVATLVRKEVAKLRKQLTRRRRRSTRSRSRRRSSSSLEITTSSRKRSSSRRRSSRRSSSSSIKVSVAGSKGLKSLASKLKAIKSKKVKVTVKSSGSKALKSLAKRVKAIKGGKHKVTVKTAGTKSLKSLRKAEKSIKSATHHVKVKTSGVKELKTLQNNITDVHKRVDSLTKALKKDTFGKAIAKQAEEAVKSLKGKGNFSKQFETMTKQFTKDLKNMSKFAQKQFKDMWSAIKKSSSDGQKFVLSKFNTFKSSYTHGWSNLQNGIKKAFNRFWNDMRSLAHSGLRRVFSVLNSAISKIDNVVSEFGGNKKAVGTVKFAKGTDANGRLLHDTLAVVNDAETGPRQEAIVTDKNDVLLPKGNNVPVFLRKGWGVLNGTQTKSLGLPHFAGGTGLKQLYKIAKHNWEHPKQTANNMFGAVKGLTGAINQLAQGMNKKGTNQGKKWWSQLWKMVEDKVDDDLGPASGLLKAVEEIGRGKHYLWGGYGLDSKGLDCSGLVSTALEHYYHSGWGHLDVGGLWQHAHRISRSEAKPGDPVFWLPDEHVGVYAGHGMYYSAYGPNNGGPIGMQPVGSGATFGRFKGINTEGSKNAKEAVKVKANNRLQKQIKNQVGQGFWKTIQKIADKYGEQFNGANSISGSMIEAAARKMHVHLPDGFVKDVLRVAMSESGNRNIQQQIHDANSGGNEAQGPLQFTPQTFKAFAMPGHTNIHNPYDELLAFFNNSDWRNSIGWTTIWGHRKFDWLHSGPIGHRRYANGGIANKPSIFGEAGPEMAIPLIPSKATRAWSLIGKAVGILSSQSGLNGQNQQISEKEEKEEKEEHDFRQAVLLLLTEIAGKSDVAKITLTTPAGRALWSIIKPFARQENKAELTRLRRGLSGR